MTRILVLSFFPAFVPPENGGQARLFHFYLALSNWFEVRLLSSSYPEASEECVRHGVNFTERRIPKDAYFARQWAKLEPAASGGDLSGPCLAASGASPTKMHRAYLEEVEQADVIIHDSPFTIEYDFLACADGKPRIYNSYNCESELYRQLHPAAVSAPIHAIVAECERKMLATAQAVFYCSAADLAAMRELAPDASFAAEYVPNGVNLGEVAAGQGSPRGEERRSVVFVGSGHPPNRRAAEFIVRELAPAMPEVRFDIVGSCLPEGRYPRNVARHGVVDTARKDELLATATCAINPMDSGSGANVKVLDYMAIGLPVVSTPFGMRGIEARSGIEYFEAGLEVFAEKLVAALGSGDRLRQTGLAGEHLARNGYSWIAIAQRAAESIRRVHADNEARRRQEKHVLVLNDYDSYASVGGGATRTKGICQAIARWSPVVMLVFDRADVLRSRQVSERICVISVPMSPEHLAEIAVANSRHHVASDDIIASRHAARSFWFDRAYAALRAWSRAIVVEHCYLTVLPIAYGDRFIHSSQNHELALKTRMLAGHPDSAELLADLQRIERGAVELSATSVAVSADDAHGLAEGARTAGPMLVVPNGAAWPAVPRVADEARIGEEIDANSRSAVFIGSAHMPNVEAARFITDTLAPRCGELFFHIAGSVCDALAGAPRNVRLWGVLSDGEKTALLQRCRVGLNPMLSGGGSNVKLADYLANGLFVVTTEFGLRGYPESVREHIAIAGREEFAECLRDTIDMARVTEPGARQARRELFAREFSMEGLAAKFVDILRGLEQRRLRVLVVTYRYAWPPRGGAEVHLDRILRALGRSGLFDLDLVCPDVCEIHNRERFAEDYPAGTPGAAVEIPNLRFARFALDAPAPIRNDEGLRRAWNAQQRFERALHALVPESPAPALCWGWGYPEESGGSQARWAFLEATVYLGTGGRLVLEGVAPRKLVLSARGDAGACGGPWVVDGAFRAEFETRAATVTFSCSAPEIHGDARPLAFLATRVEVNGVDLDFNAPTTIQAGLQRMEPGAVFEALDQASAATRAVDGVRLTELRGPHSKAMERYVAERVADYDLVIGHNVVFRPAAVAVDAAAAAGVSSILIPHFHLDDDYYHFPDLIECAGKASLVLAAPRIASEFLRDRGCRSTYMATGCDTGEPFAEADARAFRSLHPSPAPFVLVLGRKAGAKGYRDVIGAVSELNARGRQLEVVLIGPDDDRIPLDSAVAHYLGAQPRSVVRGALMECLCLCNMSQSESFGIVLLEAWLAGRPVVVNSACAAFHDLARHGENALMVTKAGLPAAIESLLLDEALCRRLAQEGRAGCAEFDWERVSEQMVRVCESTALAGKQTRADFRGRD